MLIFASLLIIFECICSLILCPFRPEKEPQFKFIYFNHMNLAEKSTIHMRKTASVCLTSVHPDLMKILGDINCDFARYTVTVAVFIFIFAECLQTKLEDG